LLQGQHLPQYFYTPFARGFIANKQQNCFAAQVPTSLGHAIGPDKPRPGRPLTSEKSLRHPELAS
jgi:hypothetical protein